MSQPDTVTAGIPAVPAARRRTGRRQWRIAGGLAMAVPAVVMTPLVTLAPGFDHRFNVYWHGALFHDNPLRIVPHTVQSLPTYLRLGNFRPLGRMVEKALDLGAYGLVEAFGVPANVALRVVSVAVFAVVGLAVLVLAESIVAPDRMFRQPPSRLAVLTPFAFGAGCVAAGSSSVAVLFGGLYGLSTALVLLTAAVVARVVVAVPGRLARRRAILAVLAGAALACFNELTYLALPVATVAALARGRWVLGADWRTLARGAAARLLACLWLGFLPTFLLIRAVIWAHCRDGGCYAGSDISLGPDVLATLPNRLLSWLPPLLWSAARDGNPRGLVSLFAVVALGALAWRAIRIAPRLRPVDTRAAAALAVVAGTLVLLAGLLAALNAQVQGFAAAGQWGVGWRDSALTAAGGALLLAAAGVTVAARAGGVDRWVLAGAVALIALTAAGSTAANQRYLETTAADPESMLVNRIALTVVDFRTDPAADADRCAMRAQFLRMHPRPAYQRRFDESLELVSRTLHAAPFCAAVGR